MKEYKRYSTFVIFFFSFIYMEFIYRMLLHKTIFIISSINMIIFILCYSILMYILTRLFREKVNRFIFYFTLIFWTIWFAAQYVVKDFFDFYISFSILQIADQVTSFLSKAVIETIKRLPGIIALAIPLVLAIILRKKIMLKKTNNIKIAISLCFLILFSIGYVYSLNIKKTESYSPHELFYEVNNPSLNIEKVGIINTFWVDTYRFIFGFDEKINIDNNGKDKITTEVNYEPNILDIDFDSIISDYSNNDKIVMMSNYFKNDTGSYQNEYTGKFKGKNLILFMAESFNEIAVDKNITPTLYKLVNNGFVFKNFYTPTIYSTIGGEFQELTGLYANFSSLKKFRSGDNTYPMGIANMFKNEGYNTFAYHNNSYNFQDRNVYLKSLGFDNFLACFNGLESKVKCSGIWPQSDVEMIDATFSDYENSDSPFMVFYATVSGHAGYSFEGNSMSKKHKEEIDAFNLPYSSPVKAYLAAQMELDKALEDLINKLEEKGILDDTVIALVGDHYPYELTVKQVNEASNYEKDDKIEINHSNFILYNSTMDKVEINKVGSQIDVLPTIYNLFGLKYDSRLIIGKDILSTEDGLAIFDNRSWVTNKGKYFAATGEFILNDGQNVEEDYISIIKKMVNNRINLSQYIIDYDYYNIAYKYKK
ncbi:MAG: sulfatase-like hydrolase/transferase [bacterium]|nr:sulfatase-like hydrolase/transferase [bacterium]